MFPIFFGVVGMVFHLSLSTFGFDNFFVKLLIISVSLLLIGQGSKQITKNYSKEKGNDIKLIVGSCEGVIVIIGGILALFYNPLVGIGVTALLALTFLTAVRFMYKDNKNR